MSGLAALLAGHNPPDMYQWHNAAHVPDIEHAVEHAGWKFVYLDGWTVEDKESFLKATAAAFKHIGLYAYRRLTVLRLAALAPTVLEETEMLEQLRALEHGIRIRVVQTDLDSIGVDTEADVARVRALLAASPAVPLARPVHDHAQP